MQQDHFVWLLDPRVLEAFKFARFHWWELISIAVVLGALVAYAVLAVLLDRRARRRRRRAKRLARLETWLEAARLSPEEEESLWELAGEHKPLALYAVLADPVRFEHAVQQALGGGDRLPFLDRLRVLLGYCSDNPTCPVVSTRQLLPGDHLRFSVWEEGTPQGHYAVVTAVSAAGLAVELTETGFHDVTATRGVTELFLLRNNDLEVRFPLVVRSSDAQRHRLLLTHQVVRRGQRPRGTRLPLLRPIAFRVQARPAAPELGELPDWLHPAAPPAGAQGEEMRGGLLEMSEGGFSMVTVQAIPEGAYVHFDMPLPRSRMLPIVGRVLDCRSFAGNRWLVRCELRGLLPTQRNTLGQLLRLEQARRIRDIQAERRKRGGGEAS